MLVLIPFLFAGVPTVKTFYVTSEPRALFLKLSVPGRVPGFSHPLWWTPYLVALSQNTNPPGGVFWCPSQPMCPLIVVAAWPRLLGGPLRFLRFS